MDKISINLLPPELEQVAKTKAKQTRLSMISIVVLLVIIGITATALSLSLLEKKIESDAQNDLASAQQRVDSLRSGQNVLYQLKTRIGLIDTLTKDETAPVKAFLLVASLTPPSVTLDTFSVDKKNNISLGAEGTDSAGFETFLENLSTSKLNQNKIAHTSLDSLSLKGDLNYRGEMTINLK